MWPFDIFTRKGLRDVQGAPSWGRLVWRRLWRQRRGKVALWLLCGWMLLALLADFLANDKPLWCRVDGFTYWPVWEELTGTQQWPADFYSESWHARTYEAVVWPPVPWAPNTLDSRNRNYRGPFDAQDVPAPRFRHWLGTDRMGRDVLAGMVHGARVALVVCVVAFVLAGLIGVVMGGLAGFWGDDGMRVRADLLVLSLLGLAAGLYEGFVAGPWQEEGTTVGSMLWRATQWWLAAALVVWLWWRLVPDRWMPRWRLPLDLWIMRLIELMDTLPVLLILIVLSAVVGTASIVWTMLLIPLIGWYAIARFTRGELLSVRARTWIEAARTLGLPEWRIFWRHALPNAIGPVLIVLVYFTADVVAIEASLSFLGLGTAPDEITWGKLLAESRHNIRAWWLAVFPGMAIFGVLWLLHTLVGALNNALEDRE